MSDDSVRISRWTAVLSGAFALGLTGAGFLFQSQLALAQAADSAVDFAGALVLAWVVQVARRPSDAGHPWGHTRAEPLGALAIALLAAVLAVQVTASGVSALVEGRDVELDATLVLLFLGKVAFKGGVFLLTRRAASPALRALAIDARNDLLVGAVSIVGFVGASFGSPDWDAWLSFPVAAWILWSGIELARENVDLLMGTAPPSERIAELSALAAAVPGVVEAHQLRAHHLGTRLSVHVHVSVCADLTIRQGHDIGEAVRLRIEREDDVSDCAVHVDPARTEGSEGSAELDGLAGAQRPPS